MAERRPATITVTKEGVREAEPGAPGSVPITGTLTIVRRWGGAEGLFLAVAGVLVLGMSIALGVHAWSERAPLAEVSMLPLLPAIAGGVIAFAGMLKLFNRTTIVATAARLEVRNGPIPWRAGNGWDAKWIRYFDAGHRGTHHHRRTGRPAVHAKFGDESAVIDEKLESMHEARVIADELNVFYRFVDGAGTSTPP
jgi:hypothetical protein